MAETLVTGAGLRRLDYVDGLRALAALWVLLHHALETSDRLHIMDAKVVGPIISSLLAGQFPVMMFLVLSGFCLYYPLVRKNPDSPSIATGFGPYILRRARRIVPPYLAAAVICLGLIAVVPGTINGATDPIWKTALPVSSGSIVSHALLLHNLIPSHAFKIDYPMWSIGLEWQLYLLFPMLVWAFRKFKPWPVVAASLLIMLACRVGYTHVGQPLAGIVRNGPFAYLGVFAGGMLVARLTVLPPKKINRLAYSLAIVAGFIYIRLSSGNGFAHDVVTMGVTMCILLLATEREGAVNRILSKPWLVTMGVFSYSIYLVHAPVLHVAWAALQGYGLSRDMLFAILVAGVPVIVAIAYGFHCLFERPFMKTGGSKPVLEPPVADAFAVVRSRSQQTESAASDTQNR